MFLIDTNCPSCTNPLTIRIDVLGPGWDRKTYTCSKCLEKIVFEYKLSMERGKRLYVKSDWMRAQYIDEGKTMQEIADICGCSAMTIRDWLLKHNIATRNRGEKGNK